MSNFPNQIDDDVALPRVDDNITEIGADAINALRDAAFNIESNVGINAQGTASSIAARLGVSLDPAGNIKASALTSLGLVTLPITDSQISPTAGIQESKLNLSHKTADLFNLIENNEIDINTALNFINVTGSKVEPHIAGTGFRHLMNAIDVAANSTQYFANRTSALRDNSNLYNLFNDINNDLVSHEKADSTLFGSTPPTSISVGTIPPAGFGHVASGIYLNPVNFSFIPESITNLQSFAQFIDNSNIFILGTRVQTFYNNGISRTARSTVLTSNTQGQLVVPSTQVTTFLLAGGSTTPVDSIDNGDNIIQFTPSSTLASSTLASNNSFDAQFIQIKVGDVITINYGSFIVNSLIEESKLIVSGGNKTYIVRINSKNVLAGTNFTATISRSLVNLNKYGVLALAQANSPTGSLPSLIAGNPRGAQCLGIDFNADQIDSTHYLLYLVLYPNGNPISQLVNLAAIDVSGNLGATPGKYTLDSVVEATNNSFRKAGFNYRFIAFQNQGNFGIMLADPYGGASFSIISGALASNGLYDQILSTTISPNNVIGVPGFDQQDALGFGPSNGNIASPPFTAAPASAAIAQTPTKLFVPLTRDNYYVNGVERERFALEVNQSIDGYGDSFWPATILNKTVIPGTRVEVTYRVNLDLSTSRLQVGKTLVIQGGTTVDSGRFFIKNIQFTNCACSSPTPTTDITVYDAIHSTGVTPFASAPVGTPVSLYFNSDTIEFSAENASDFTLPSPLVNFKRWFEIYVDEDGYTFSHERGRINISGSTTTINSVSLFSSSELSLINISKISPKLRGYAFSSVVKINFQVTSYNATTGIYSGFLCQFDGSTVSNAGPVTIGKKGNIVRFYDQSNVDYIDLIFSPNDAVPTISTTKNIDIQLFPTFELDDQVMLIGSVQVNDSTNTLGYLKDERQFGNISEKQLSNSALDFISAPTKLINDNGVIRGFDISSTNGSNIFINGGAAVVNGKIIQVNNEVITVPALLEAVGYTLNSIVTIGTNTVNVITWFICVDDKGEFQLIASTDYDPNGSFAATYTGTGVDHNRIFFVINPNLSIPTAYQVRGTYFADLIANQKDLVPVATVVSTVTFGTSYTVTSLTVSDARRFTTNGYGGLVYPLTLGNNAAFRNFTSLNTWLNQLLNLYSSSNSIDGNLISSKVIVKGPVAVPSTVNIGWQRKVTFEGDGGAFIITALTGFNLGNNIEFKNIKFDYNAGTSSGGYVSANLANYTNACLMGSITGATTLSNITFDNCHFTAPAAAHFTWLAFVMNSTIVSSTNTIGAIQNIKITNCRFESLDASQDQQAGIVFALGSSTLNNEAVGPHLVNCLIENNIFNKNQMIMIGGMPFNGSNQILDAIVPVNCAIRGNTCGAIAYLTKRNNPSTLVNGVVVNDKDNGLYIEKNTCRIIYCAATTGIGGAGSSRTTQTLLVYSGTVWIKDNVCNWIHVGIVIPAGYASPEALLVIKNNKLNAFDPAWLATYYVGTSVSFNNAIETIKTVI